MTHSQQFIHFMPTPVSDFEYLLPEELIAQHSVSPRDASRLLVLKRETGERSEGIFRDIRTFLKAGDVLVFNTTKVFRARLQSEDRKKEIFVLKIQNG